MFLQSCQELSRSCEWRVKWLSRPVLPVLVQLLETSCCGLQTLLGHVRNKLPPRRFVQRHVSLDFWFYPSSGVSSTCNAGQWNDHRRWHEKELFEKGGNYLCIKSNCFLFALRIVLSRGSKIPHVSTVSCLQSSFHKLSELLASHDRLLLDWTKTIKDSILNIRIRMTSFGKKHGINKASCSSLNTASPGVAFHERNTKGTQNWMWNFHLLKILSESLFLVPPNHTQTSPIYLDVASI